MPCGFKVWDGFQLKTNINCIDLTTYLFCNAAQKCSLFALFNVHQLVLLFKCGYDQKYFKCSSSFSSWLELLSKVFCLMFFELLLGIVVIIKSILYNVYKLLRRNGGYGYYQKYCTIFINFFLYVVVIIKSILYNFYGLLLVCGGYVGYYQKYSVHIMFINYFFVEVVIIKSPATPLPRQSYQWTGANEAIQERKTWNQNEKILAGRK